MPEQNTDFNPDTLPDLLPMYYKRLFPFGPFYRWLSYGNTDSRNFSNREFSFTLHGDVYIRYQSFNKQSEMEEAITNKIPYKIDIGAIFSFPPSSHRQLASSMVPIARELVFDIDLTDYDDVRSCCQGADVCTKCWKFMSLGCKILDTALREDFGFNNLLWVFSGRRGMHCWVCDTSARLLSGSERSAVAEYLQLIASSGSSDKKVSLPNTEKLHSSVRRAADVIRSQFLDVCIEGQGLLEKSHLLKKFLSIIPEENLRNRIRDGIEKCSSNEEKWQFIVSKLQNKDEEHYHRRPWLLEEILIEFAYPRLDINVTKGMNHLLKSPFCIHPKTGKICVPFNPRNVDRFNPTAVPNLNQLVDELQRYDEELKQHKDNGGVNTIQLQDYQKTSMIKSVQLFEDFVRKLEDSRRAKNSHFDISEEF